MARKTNSNYGWLWRSLGISLVFALLLRLLGGPMYDAYVVLLPAAAVLFVGAWQFFGGDDARRSSNREDTDEKREQEAEAAKSSADYL